MKTRLFLALFILFAVKSMAAGADDKRGNIVSFDSIPQWIQQHIEFPQDASQYGIAGTEQFVISATWDGRVFITSSLNTLNPAFEEAIKNVVRRAPKSRFSGISLANIYREVQIDFASIIPESQKNDIVRISHHTFPQFMPAGERVPLLSNTQERFIDWVSSRICSPRKLGLKHYSDTVSVSYTINRCGKIEDVVVANCENRAIQIELGRVIKKSPRWQPAVTDSQDSLNIRVYDQLLISTTPRAEKLSVQLYRDEILRNSSDAPVDSDMIVLNPESKPRYAGDSKSIARLIKDSLVVDKRIMYEGAFIIEKDGSTSNIHIASTDSSADSIIIGLIERSKWTPARQGGEAVRTCYTFVDGQLPPARYIYQTPNTYPHFMSGGKDRSLAYNSLYNKIERDRWRQFKEAYPDAEATVRGYGIFRSMDNDTYIEALMMRGIPSQNIVRTVVREK